MERLTRLPETAKDDNFPQVGRARAVGPVVGNAGAAGQTDDGEGEGAGIGFDGRPPSTACVCCVFGDRHGGGGGKAARQMFGRRRCCVLNGNDQRGDPLSTGHAK